jgi:hypothetical protein
MAKIVQIIFWMIELFEFLKKKLIFIENTRSFGLSWRNQNHYVHFKKNIHFLFLQVSIHSKHKNNMLEKQSSTISKKKHWKMERQLKSRLYFPL